MKIYLRQSRQVALLLVAISLILPSLGCDASPAPQAGSTAEEAQTVAADAREEPTNDEPATEAARDAEVRRTGEAIAVAAAKAEAFSDEVILMQQRFEDVTNKLRGNQLLYEQESSRSPSYGIGPGGSARRAGDAAARAYLVDAIDKLKEQQLRVKEQYEKTLQEEAWARLSREERRLAAKHELVPGFSQQDVGKPAKDGRSQPKHAKLDDWQIVRLEGLKYQVAFPGRPEHETSDSADARVYRDGDVTFRFTRFLQDKVPTDVPVKQVVTAQAIETVNRRRREGRPAANRTIVMAGIDGQEVCCFYKLNGKERENRHRMTVIDRYIVVIEVLGIFRQNAANLAQASAYLDSFQRTK